MVWAPRLHGEPEGPTFITGTARIVLATFYIASLSFQDAHPNDGSGSRRSSAFTGQVRSDCTTRFVVQAGNIMRGRAENLFVQDKDP